MRKKEIANLLQERTERIMVLEQRMEAMNQTIDGYRAKEQSILDTLSDSQSEARNRIEMAQQRADALTKSAQEQAEALVANAQSQADALLAQAQAQGDGILAQAQAQAESMIASAQQESQRMLGQAQADAAEYQQVTQRYNALVAQTAAQMHEQAQQFLSFANRAMVMPVDAVVQSAAQNAASLEDANGDPAKVMQNIYTLQNRDLPESVQPQQALEDAAPEQAPEETLEQQAQDPMEQAEAQPQQPLEADMQQHPEQEEEIPDLAPRPEREWRPEDEVETESEWQPEMELSAEDIPTVSELMPDGTEELDGELSLDALLDEIIKAGE